MGLLFPWDSHGNLEGMGTQIYVKILIGRLDSNAIQ